MNKRRARLVLVLSLIMAITTTMGATASAAVSGKSKDVQVVKGTVTNNVDMTRYEKGKVVKVWLPVAQSNDNQKITKVKYEVGKGGKAKITKDKKGNKMLYVRWGKNADPANRTITLSFHAKRNQVIAPKIKEKGKIPEKISDKYLKATSTVPVTGEVKDLADKITKGKKTQTEKARAIYDWVYDNMVRDESVVGCGTGNVPELLNTKSGKCTDINSVFVGLCRAAGVPAREMFGIRMNDADITKNQHCWAEFYIQGTGWIAADPADALKAVLKNNWSKDQQEALDTKESYWGGWDAQRVELSRGRDITLNPAQNGKKLNNFGYPYAEVDGNEISCYAPDQFVYNYTFQADK